LPLHRLCAGLDAATEARLRGSEAGHAAIGSPRRRRAQAEQVSSGRAPSTARAASRPTPGACDDAIARGTAELSGRSTSSESPRGIDCRERKTRLSCGALFGAIEPSAPHRRGRRRAGALAGHARAVDSHGPRSPWRPGPRRHCLWGPLSRPPASHSAGDSRGTPLCPPELGQARRGRGLRLRFIRFLV